MGPKRLWVQRDYGSKEIMGTKRLWVQRDYGYKEIMGPKRLWVQRDYGKLFTVTRVIDKIKEREQKKRKKSDHSSL